MKDLQIADPLDSECASADRLHSTLTRQLHRTTCRLTDAERDEPKSLAQTDGSFVLCHAGVRRRGDSSFDRWHEMAAVLFHRMDSQAADGTHQRLSRIECRRGWITGNLSRHLYS